MREKLKVGDVRDISDGNGGTLQAKIVFMAPYNFVVRKRKTTKGARWGKPVEMTRREFWVAYDAAN